MRLAAEPTQTWRFNIVKSSLCRHLLLFLLFAVILTSATAISTSNNNNKKNNKNYYHDSINIFFFNNRTSLALVNPWLSACDISSPATATDLQGTCSIGAMVTKHSGKYNNNSNNNKQHEQHTIGAGGFIHSAGRSSNNNNINNNYNNNVNNNYNNNKKKNLTNSLRNIGSSETSEQGPGPPSWCKTSECRSCRQQQQTDNSNNNNVNNNNKYFTSNQCLCYLDESHKDRVCASSAGPGRAMLLRGVRLRHCCEHSVLESLSADAFSAVMNGSTAVCSSYLAALLEVDQLASGVTCKFREVLTRYDCEQRYSVRFECSHCQEAYRRWVCASLLPFFPRPGHRVRPCRSVCNEVEQRCPFFLPGDRAPGLPTQYAGEPTFLCLDPNIPETGEQLSRSSYGDDADCCYSHCGDGDPPSLCVSSHCGQEGAAEEDDDKRWSPEQCEPPAPPATPSSSSNVGRTEYSACAPPPHHPHAATNTTTMTKNSLLLLLSLILLLLLFLLGDNNTCCWMLGPTIPLLYSCVLTDVFNT
ncbi:uncharacterized protein Mid1 [Anabrus simplex]|uniref:uncharacterized protein Mid1 n=1 Tax=Anabrus simplex TaxID=316456 RepID=UPI0035A2B3A1